MEYAVYEEYKKTDNNWLEDVPEHWELTRLKFLSEVNLQYGANEAAEMNDRDLPRFIRITDVKSDGSLHDNTFRSLPEEIAKPFLLEIGDILLARSGATVGKSFIYSKSWGVAAFAGYLIRFRANTNIIETNFAYLFFQSTIFWININSTLIQSTIQNFSAEKYANIVLPIPPIKEQQKIAHFLDDKTQQIDQLIKKKKALIEKLNEQRIAMITQAVTKGIDKTATNSSVTNLNANGGSKSKGMDSPSKMKPSGVDWLGDVPEHWDLIPLKFSLENPITDGPHETPEIFNSGIPFLSAEAVKNDKLDFSRKRGFISPEEHNRFSKKYKPKRGDVYMIKSGATTGNVARVETDAEFNIWSPLAALRPDKKMTTTDFLFYFMKSKSFFYSVELGWSFGTQQNIGMGVIANLQMTLPPVNEQKEIVAYIEKQLAHIDKLTAMSKQTIKYYQEYRSALITAAVTGKIDVRNTPLPQDQKEVA